MKKIGLVGGIGPASTVAYYRGLVDKTLQESGGTLYPEVVIDSVNMLRHDAAIARGDEDALAASLLVSLSHLKAAGAEVAAITANTEHLVWQRLAPKLPLATVSIVDAALDEVDRLGARRVLVFATEATWRSRLYEKALTRAGVTAIVPTEADSVRLGQLIYPNLENGIVRPDDRAEILAMAAHYIETAEADALLLGCTELPLAIAPADVSVPLIDTTACHIDAIYRAAMAPL